MPFRLAASVLISKRWSSPVQQIFTKYPISINNKYEYLWSYKVRKCNNVPNWVCYLFLDLICDISILSNQWVMFEECGLLCRPRTENMVVQIESLWGPTLARMPYFGHPWSIPTYPCRGKAGGCFQQWLGKRPWTLSCSMQNEDSNPQPSWCKGTVLPTYPPCNPKNQTRISLIVLCPILLHVQPRTMHLHALSLCVIMYTCKH